MNLILIIEDNDKNLKHVRRVLPVKGHSTTHDGKGECGSQRPVRR